MFFVRVLNRRNSGNRNTRMPCSTKAKKLTNKSEEERWKERATSREFLIGYVYLMLINLFIIFDVATHSLSYGYSGIFWRSVSEKRTRNNSPLFPFLCSVSRIYSYYKPHSPHQSENSWWFTRIQKRTYRYTFELEREQSRSLLHILWIYMRRRGFFPPLVT